MLDHSGANSVLVLNFSELVSKWPDETYSSALLKELLREATCPDGVAVRRLTSYLINLGFGET